MAVFFSACSGFAHHSVAASACCDWSKLFAGHSGFVTAYVFGWSKQLVGDTRVDFFVIWPASYCETCDVTPMDLLLLERRRVALESG